MVLLVIDAQIWLTNKDLYCYERFVNGTKKVIEVIKAFETACGHQLKYKICSRRAGDIATCYASCEKAQSELG